ncbi:formate dehydrogenase subunit delta [Parahaliea maris]|uniref:Formate dehydrogenase subunit delta n=2 Tax=Parahaliea maris TaxID=2716870 RepID=A0A5C9AAV9_9GAMM|nr:formate dehydrogenase subunit delta [Parahaliea maris]
MQSLVHMANQIAVNLEHGPGGEHEAAERVASHLRRFWSRGMREQLIEYAAGDSAGLNPVSALAAEILAADAVIP